MSSPSDRLEGQRRDVRHAMTKVRNQRTWGMYIDPHRCNGCRACQVACKAENNTPPGVSYMVVLEQERGEFPHTRRSFVPRPCMHCGKPSCILVCPVQATFKQPDGTVVMDYMKCIGCRYCATNCPYGARYFDFGESYADGAPAPAAYEQRPSPEYARAWPRQPRISPIGNVRKCHHCQHRILRSLLPACVEACPTGAITFGDLSEKESPVGIAISENPTYRLREELGNEPSVHYKE